MKNVIVMRSSLSIQCKDIGHPDCTHRSYGATEETLFGNAEYHAIEAHGYTEESWQEELSKNLEHFRKLIKKS